MGIEQLEQKQRELVHKIEDYTCHTKDCLYRKPPTMFDKVTLESIKREYQEGDVCMGELLAATPATGMSIEEAFELYIQAIKWSDGDKFYQLTNGIEMEEL